MLCFVLWCLAIRIVFGCGGTWTSYRGTFTSPGWSGVYRSGADCVYNINSPDPTKKLQIKFDHIQISYSHKLRVLNSSGDVVVNIGGHRGYSTSPASTSFVATLIRPYSQYVFAGFTSSWVECGGDWSDESGLIKSPYYPSNYHRDADCTYTITPPGGAVYVLKVEDFVVHESDYVTVQCGGFSNEVNLTGSVGVTGFGPASSFTITLTADPPNSQAKGFKMSWQGISQGDGPASVHGGLCDVNSHYRQVAPEELTGYYPTVYTAPSMESCMYLCQGRPLCKYFAYSNNVCTTMDSGQGGFCLPTPLYEKL